MSKPSVFRLLTTSCREASELASAALEGELSRRQRIALRLHLVLCRGCRQFVRQLKLLRELCASAPAPRLGAWRGGDVRLGPERRQQIKRRLRELSESEST